ncbi:centromere protein W-like [Diadema setosum]|uniref:centromere protein W-like n=1 Tax=Diadema setosum TaxID=31175 RepID=UPI003B3B2EE6
MKRKFPRSKIRAVIKNRHSQLRLGKNTDILIFLNYMMFLRRLAIKANLAAQENRENAVTPIHIQRVAKEVLKEFRG